MLLKPVEYRVKCTEENQQTNNMLFGSEMPKTQHAEHCKHLKKDSEYFSHHRSGWYVGTYNKFAYLGSLEKVSPSAYL